MCPWARPLFSDSGQSDRLVEGDGSSLRACTCRPGWCSVVLVSRTVLREMVTITGLVSVGQAAVLWSNMIDCLAEGDGSPPQSLCLSAKLLFSGLGRSVHLAGVLGTLEGGQGLCLWARIRFPGLVSHLAGKVPDRRHTTCFTGTYTEVG